MKEKLYTTEELEMINEVKMYKNEVKNRLMHEMKNMIMIYLDIAISLKAPEI